MDTGTATATAMSRQEILTFLDEYRGGESIGACLFRGWAATCKNEPLRGALRVMELREQSHAEVLERRLRELGGTPHYQANAAEFVDFLSSPANTDAMKLREFTDKAPTEQVIARLSGTADRMSGDPETQGLLRAIIEDERATLTALAAMNKTLALAN